MISLHSDLRKIICIHILCMLVHFICRAGAVSYTHLFPEVANNLILDGHTLGAVQAVITDNAWGKLTEMCIRDRIGDLLARVHYIVYKVTEPRSDPSPC